MKGRVDKSMGIVTHITETWVRITPTDPLRLAECEARKKRNCSDSSGNFPTKILVVYPCISDDNAESSMCLAC
jgi:hypothetical protein